MYLFLSGQSLESTEGSVAANDMEHKKLNTASHPQSSFRNVLLTLNLDNTIYCMCPNKTYS